MRAALARVRLHVNFLSARGLATGRTHPGGRRAAGVARDLLPRWVVFSLDDDDTRPGPLAPEIAALAQFAVELNGRLVGAGLDGLAGAVELHRRLVEALDGVARTDVEGMLAHLAALERELATMAEHLRALRALKTLLERVAAAEPPPSPVSRPAR
jgi:hypothetical protein